MSRPKASHHYTGTLIPATNRTGPRLLLCRWLDTQVHLSAGKQIPRQKPDKNAFTCPDATSKFEHSKVRTVGKFGFDPAVSNTPRDCSNYTPAEQK